MPCTKVDQEHIHNTQNLETYINTANFISCLFQLTEKGINFSSVKNILAKTTACDISYSQKFKIGMTGGMTQIKHNIYCLIQPTL
jgi:hypothetical protein